MQQIKLGKLQSHAQYIFIVIYNVACIYIYLQILNNYEYLFNYSTNIILKRSIFVHVLLIYLFFQNIVNLVNEKKGKQKQNEQLLIILTHRKTAFTAQQSVIIV